MTALADAPTGGARWQDQVYDLLRQHNVTQVAYVPDAGHMTTMENPDAVNAVISKFMVSSD